jgi:hypothetical protein
MRVFLVVKILVAKKLQKMLKVKNSNEAAKGKAT